MKVKFAAQKSEYSHCLSIVCNDKLDWDERDEGLKRMKEIEKEIKAQDDRIIWVITTEKTFEGKAASPMTMENINKSNYPKNPLEGTIYYDLLHECFREFKNGEWIDKK